MADGRWQIAKNWVAIDHRVDLPLQDAFPHPAAERYMAVRSARRTTSTLSPYTRCDARADACVDAGYSVGGFDKPNAGTATSSAASQSAVPNGSPHPTAVTGATSDNTPYTAPI